MEKKINITSTLIEKGVDAARNFLDSLIGPAIEETGLLMKDKVTLWKFRNQVKILTKAKKICEKNDISTKAISLKLLCPLLENAALEEEEELQEKWAILLSNLIDSEQNIENHVFPYILSQISKNEFDFLEGTLNIKKSRIKELKSQLEYFQENREAIEQELKNEINSLEANIQESRNSSRYTESWEVHRKLDTKQWELKSLDNRVPSLIKRMGEPQWIDETGVREYEISNLTRLGLIKMAQEVYAGTHSIEIPNYSDEEYLRTEMDIDVESEVYYILTELGEMFIHVCTEKSCA